MQPLARLSSFLMMLLVFAVLLVAPPRPLRAQDAHPNAAVGVKPGQVQIIASYLSATGKLVADTTLVTILPLPAATLTLYNAFDPPRWISTIPYGKTFCPIVTVRDTLGNVLTGLKVALKSTDTSVVKITPSAVCPDTSVDPSRMNSNPLPPTGFALRQFLRSDSAIAPHPRS